MPGQSHSVHRRSSVPQPARRPAGRRASSPSWSCTGGRACPRTGRSRRLRADGARVLRGLAGLQVGLLDGAVEDFTAATAVGAGRAGRSGRTWAWRTCALARSTPRRPPSTVRARWRRTTSAIVFLRGRLDTARGNRDAARDLSAPGGRPRPGQPAGADGALVQEIENAAGPDADAEAQRLRELVGAAARQPGDAGRARPAGRQAWRCRPCSATRCRGSCRVAAGWPPEVSEQFRAVQQAVAPPDLGRRRSELAFLRNILAAFRPSARSRRAVTASAELIAEPFTHFLRMPAPAAHPTPADRGCLTFAGLPRDRHAGRGGRHGPSHSTATRPRCSLSPTGRRRRCSRRSARRLPFRWRSPGRAGCHRRPGGRRLEQRLPDRPRRRRSRAACGCTVQAADGSFIDATATRRVRQVGRSLGRRPASGPRMSRWMAISISSWASRTRRPWCCGTMATARGQRRRCSPGRRAAGVRVGRSRRRRRSGRGAARRRGGLHRPANLQAGVFEPMAPPPTASGLLRPDDSAMPTPMAASISSRSTGGRSGARRAGGRMARWRVVDWAGAAAVPRAGRGAVDAGRPRQQRRARSRRSRAAACDAWSGSPVPIGMLLAPRRVTSRPATSARSISTATGCSISPGSTRGGPSRLTARHRAAITSRSSGPARRPRPAISASTPSASAAIVEVRSGLLVQKQVITGPVVHVGLGDAHGRRRHAHRLAQRRAAGGVRSGVDQAIVAEQRLKGSCPWVFADDGTGLHFVTDFLWRSPLGLRINAQDTAGVTQTEDWVKIRGEPAGGHATAPTTFASRAELWETHFIDHVSLMVVDHPGGRGGLRRRAIRARRSRRASRCMPRRRLVPVARMRGTTHGRDVTDLVRAARRQRISSTFARGAYQGVAEDHFVEFDSATPIPADAPSWLVAHGWIYPTDSSINVAIGQGRHGACRTVSSLEAQDAVGAVGARGAGPRVSRPARTRPC